jgi:phosphohistidine phosphatase
MELLVLRHAPAQDKDEASQQGVPDPERALTPDGATKMKRISRALARRVPEVSLLVTSPWRRAIETGDLLQKAFGRLQRLESEALIPGAGPDALVRELAAYASDPAVAVVGHEPHLSGWVSWCLTGSLEPVLELRKAGACLLRFSDGLGAGRGRLLWLMTPAILTKL